MERRAVGIFGAPLREALKIVAIAIAWWLQMVISAFYSALRGGRLFADGAFQLLQRKGLLDKLPASIVKQPCAEGSRVARNGENVVA